MSRTISDWGTLLQPEQAELLHALAAQPQVDVALLTRLRRRWTPEVVAAATELTRARSKAARKFEHPELWLADVAGMEQATSTTIARYKSMRFQGAGIAQIVDLCCGIGGDTHQLARVSSVVAYDLDPLRAWMTGHNVRIGQPLDAALECSTHDVDVTQLDPEQAPTDAAFHFDPSRRQEASTTGPPPGRRYRVSDWVPGWEFIEHWRHSRPNGAIKLGPGVDRNEVDSAHPTSLEFVEENGELKQAVAWCGSLAENGSNPEIRRATALITERSEESTIRDQNVLTTIGSPEACPSLEPSDPIAGWLYSPRPALERADLIGTLANELGLTSVSPGLGLLTSPTAIHSQPIQPEQSPGVHGWLRPYEIVAVLPWRHRSVDRWLNQQGAGPVTFRARGGVKPSSQLAKKYSANRDLPYHVFLCRRGMSETAIITRRGGAH